MVTEVSPVSTTVYLPPVTTRCLRRAYKVGILPREQESGGEKHMPGSGLESKEKEMQCVQVKSSRDLSQYRNTEHQ